jgi:puromycin-sensitive aminopeptidase
MQEEKDRISRALGALKDQKLLQRVLEFSISVGYLYHKRQINTNSDCLQDEVRSQDTVFVIGSVATKKEGRKLAWDFMKKNWQKFMERYQVRFRRPQIYHY